MKPVITSIRYSSGPARKQPKVGDRRTTKKHGLQIRVFEMHGGMCVVSGGRHRYDWKSPADLVGTMFNHLLTPEERSLFAKDKVLAT